jgi:hypothetical protein
MDESRGLQRILFRLTFYEASGNAPQFAVNMRCKGVERAGIAARPCEKKPRGLRNFRVQKDLIL